MINVHYPKEVLEPMRIMIVGCGRVGSELALSLESQGHSITVVDTNNDALKQVPPEFKGQAICADVLSEGTLRRIGIESIDAVALVTNSDSVNAVAGEIIKSVYKIPHVVVRNYDPHLNKVHESFGHTVIRSASWEIKAISDMIATFK
jgi:trk system potassium uptake protein TrkA